MNQFIISGKIAKMYKNSDKNVKVIIADQYRDITSFIPVMCFDEKATWATEHLMTGDHVLARGVVGLYDAGTGEKKISLIAHQISFEGYPSPRRRETAAQAYSTVVQQPTERDPYF